MISRGNTVSPLSASWRRIQVLRWMKHVPRYVYYFYNRKIELIRRGKSAKKCWWSNFREKASFSWRKELCILRCCTAVSQRGSSRKMVERNENNFKFEIWEILSFKMSPTTELLIIYLQALILESYLIRHKTEWLNRRNALNFLPFVLSTLIITLNSLFG